MAGERRDSRQLIAVAAREEFARHGFAAARTERIARAAGVNKQLLFYYFGSKAGLYDAVMQEAGAALAAAVHAPAGAADGRATERLRRHLAAVFDALAEPPGVARALLEPGKRETARASLGEVVAQLSRTISEGQGLGFFRDDADPHRAARQAVVLLLGYLSMEDVLPETGGTERRAAWLKGVQELLTRSLSW